MLGFAPLFALVFFQYVLVLFFTRSPCSCGVLPGYEVSRDGGSICTSFPVLV